MKRSRLIVLALIFTPTLMILYRSSAVLAQSVEFSEPWKNPQVALDRKYAERRDEAKKRGYKWGAYHLGRPGDPVKQADFFLETVKPAAEDLIALDLESTDETKDMSLAEARIFVKRINEKTGHYPLVYANNKVTQAISDQYGSDDVFSKTRLWYARFKKNVTDFPSGTWKTSQSGNSPVN